VPSRPINKEPRKKSVLARKSLAQRRAWLREYAIIASLAVFAVAIRIPLRPWLGDGLPFLTVFPVVIYGAGTTGLAGGLFAAMVALPLVSYLLLPPAFNLAVADPEDRLTIVRFLIGSITVSASIHGWRLTVMRAHQQERDAIARQWSMLRDVLASATEGKLFLLNNDEELPEPLEVMEEPIMLTVEAGLRELRAVAQMAAGAAGHPEERQYDLVTAASEAGMNAIVHGGGGEAVVSANENGTVQVRVVDGGTGIALDHLPRATLARGFSTKATLGQGMKMMLETADRIYLLTGPGGTALVLEQDLRKPPPAWLAECGLTEDFLADFDEKPKRTPPKTQPPHTPE
jgi:anti-sigma regulatory factor (Ser/Thr protein kinase)